MKIRPFWVLAHRYVGLAMTVFLIIVGLTGSLLAFYAELDRAVNPSFYVDADGRRPLDFDVLIEKAEGYAPQAQIRSLWFTPNAANLSVAPRADPSTGQPYALDYDQLILDPYTGAELGRRTWGAISEGTINLMPFLYKLHYDLALDDAGMWILGITALVWTLDSFVGFYLTLPAFGASAASQPWPKRWQRSWSIKWRGSSFRINYDLHRAGGLWLWLALLIFAWSSVYMNLADTVYQKVMQTVSDFHEPWSDMPSLERPLENPALSLKEAYRLGQQRFAEASIEHGFKIEAPSAVWYNAERGFYALGVRSDKDFQDKNGQTRLVLDANSGEQKMLLLPSGQYNGTTITSWLSALHMANVFGLPYRVFVCILGLSIVTLSVTGVVIWLRKRRRAGY